MVYGVFLRAINVGKHNRIRMDALRSLVERLGYGGVRTYLQTGNVVLESDEPAAVVAERLEEALAGVGVRGTAAMVRSRQELLALGDSAVFAPYPAEEHRYLAIFTRSPIDSPEPVPYEARGATFVAFGSGALLAVIPREAPRPVNVNALVESLWQTQATTRWWNVVDDFRRELTA